MKFLIIDLVTGMLIGLWMYSDAKKRRLKQPLNWLWIGILLNVLGLITYLYWHVLPSKKKA